MQEELGCLFVTGENSTTETAAPAHSTVSYKPVGRILHSRDSLATNCPFSEHSCGWFVSSFPLECNRKLDNFRCKYVVAHALQAGCSV